MLIQLANEFPEATTDGRGIRYSVYTQGCRGGWWGENCIANCKGCQNPETWSFEKDAPGAYWIMVEELVEKIKKHKFSWGKLTLCGGDPIWQAEACIELVQRLRKEKVDYDVWAYTGLTYEYILKEANEENRWGEYLKCIDILVDGPFVVDKRDITLPWRGSGNQRVIDVRKSLRKGEVVVAETE